MRAYERLLHYVAVHTASDPESESVPTTEQQFDLANMLVKEMKALGIADAKVDDKCYVYGTLPATAGCEQREKIGFIAHMDTSPDFCGKGVRPQVIENYDGGDVRLGESGRVLRVKDFPHLKKLKGKTLITTDGTTLLGSDDKSGIAEIMTAVEILQEKKLPHGTICIGFTSDEEVGAGADHFDIAGFGADYAYTLDGSEEGEIVYENFNASEAVFTIHGFNVHPGSAKNTMQNAQLIAMEINAMLPGCEIPQNTEGYEGFFHLCEMEGNVEKAKLWYIVRDHDLGNFRRREDTLRHIAKVMNEKYGEGTVELSIQEEYLNMKGKIEDCLEIVERAEDAIKGIGIEPVNTPVRGGTDGARLSFMGLPCPNLGTGGYAFHGPYEHVTAEGMDKAVEIILGIARA